MKVTILTGGSSVERDVALASASQVRAALREAGHQVRVVDTVRGPIPESEVKATLRGQIRSEPPSVQALAELERQFLLGELGRIPEILEAEVVFLALHGGLGEDGTIQSLLDVVGVPYTGSGPLASGLGMDKDISKRLFRLAGVPTPDWAMAPLSAEATRQQVGWPVVVKPSKQGSTVGLTLVRRPEDFDAAVGLALQYDDEVMVERFVPGRELTVTVLEGRALPVGEIIPKHEIFDYECKYTPGMSKEIFPADLPPSLGKECADLGVRAHEALKLGCYSRVDFRLTPEGGFFCLEANTLPGLTRLSLVPQAARAAGIEFADLCDRICRGALVKRGREQIPSR